MDRKLIRAKSAEFLKSLVEKTQKKEEPAKPDFGEEDTEKIKRLTKNVKEIYAEKKGIRSTKGN